MNRSMFFDQHPIWSRLEVDDMLHAIVFAMEIYNFDCEEGMLLPLSQRRSLRSPYCTALGGWIMVAAKDLTYESLAEAMAQGSFYSSNGPEILEYKIEGDEIVVLF